MELRGDADDRLQRDRHPDCRAHTHSGADVSAHASADSRADAGADAGAYAGADRHPDRCALADADDLESERAADSAANTCANHTAFLDAHDAAVGLSDIAALWHANSQSHSRANFESDRIADGAL